MELLTAQASPYKADSTIKIPKPTQARATPTPWDTELNISSPKV